VTEARTSILVVGDGEIARAVARAFETDGFDVQRAPTLVEGLEIAAVTTQPCCLVLMPGPDPKTLQDSVRECRGSLAASDWPIVTVVPTGTRDVEARAILGAGANGVAAWPDDHRILTSWLPRLLEKDPSRAPYTDPDRCLARTVEAKLEVSPAFGHPVSIVALEGVLVIRGAGEHSREAVRLANTVPGVRRALVSFPGGMLGA
jgi:hypothetical protein